MKIVKTSTPGAQGAPGSPWFTWTGAPSNTLGYDGALYLDVATQNLWQRTSGLYSVITNIEGAEGGPGPQGIPGINARWDGVSAYHGVVGSGYFPNGVLDNGFNGNDTFMVRVPMVAQQAITTIGVVVANVRVADSNGGEIPVGAAAKINAAVEYNGHSTQLTWSGAAFCTLNDYSWQESDATPLGFTIPAGATYFYREHRTYNGATVGLPLTGGTTPTGQGYCFQYGPLASIPDVSTSTGTFANSATMYAYRPLCLTGSTTLASYGFIGDSRAQGFGEFGTPNTDLYMGYFERSIGPKRCFINFGKVSEMLTNVTANNGLNWLIRGEVFRKYCTHGLNGYGVNDLFTGGINVATLLTQMMYFRSLFPKQWMGICDVPQENSSTDNWATSTNQSMNASLKGLMIRLNQHIRAGNLTTYDAVYSLCSVLAYQGPDSGVWPFPGYTSDGVHTTILANNAVVNSAVFVNIP